MSHPAPRPVVLIGMMGSGKTSVGRILSERTGWRFLDNDELVEAASGSTARELSHADEVELRRAERQALIQAPDTPPPGIVGAAAESSSIRPLARSCVARSSCGCAPSRRR